MPIIIIFEKKFQILDNANTEKTFKLEKNK